MAHTGSPSGQSADDAAQQLRCELEQCRAEFAACSDRIEILERKEALLARETRVLELVARGVSLSEILIVLCQWVEATYGGSFCEILLFNRATGHMELGAAPNLPQTYNDAVRSLLATQQAGPFGAAACLRQPVMADDLASDTRWAESEWCKLALRHGLRACWSTPILASDGDVLGALNVFWPQPGSRANERDRSVERFTHLASMAIERQRNEPVMQKTEERFRRIFDAVPGMVCVLNSEGAVELLNEQVLKYFGKSPEELKNWAMTDAVHPDDVGGVIEAWKHSVLTGAPFDRDQRQRRADGVYRWQHSRAHPVRDKEGLITGWYMLITDIDDLRRAEGVLQQNQAYLKEAQRLSRTGSFGWKVKTGELIWSAETFRIMGYDTTPRPTMEMVFTRVHPDDIGLIQQVTERASRDLSDIDFEHRLVMPDGTVKHAHVVAHAVADRSGAVEFVGALMDITERKQATENLQGALEQLRNSEARFRTILNAMPTHAWGALADGTSEFQNQQFLDYVGFTADQAKGWAWREAIHPDDVEHYMNRWFAIQASGAAGEAEARFRRHDGVYRRFLMRVVPLRNERREIVRWYGTNTDIEDLKQTADALRRSEQFARDQSEALGRILDALAHESSPDRIVEHVLRTLTEQLNAHSCSVWSRDASTGLLHFVYSFVAGEFRTEGDVRFAGTFPSERGSEIWPGIDIFNSGRPQIVADLREAPNFPWRADLLAQGVVTVLVVPMLVAGQVQGVVGIRFDRKRLFQPEELNLAQTLANQAMLAMQLIRISAQSRQTAVLAERNRLARDIHDTLAQGFTGVIVQLEAAADAASRGLTTEAEDHLKRAGDLARESLTDARRSVQALRPQALEQHNLSTALEDMIRKMTEQTTLQTKFEVIGVQRLLPFAWEENLLRIGQEVLTNALRHARADEFVVRLEFASDEIRLDLRDNGQGFDTLKRNDGFGLIGIRERVEQLGGELTVTTTLGKGTATLIVLPLAKIS